MRYAVLSLTGTYAETAPSPRSLVAPGRAPLFRFDRFLASVEYLLKRKKVDTVLVDQHLDFQPGFPGAVEAIRHQLERLAAAGKRLVFYARSYETSSLFLASACAERMIHPLGTVRFQGLSRSFLFYKKLLDRFDVRAEVIRRGRFKSAGDPFRVDRLDEHNREQHAALLDGTIRRYIETIRSGMGKEPSEIEELLAGKMLGAEEAVAAGWVTQSTTRGNLVAGWRKQKARETSLAKVKRSFGRGKRVAVLVLEGAIVDGRSRRDPMLGQSLGSDSFVPQIERLAKNKSVKGVVLRVNSPGGSAIASEEIAASLAQLAEKKPLVVSMSGVAGSGGYWVAVPGERIFAEANTITGSVGVISMLFSARKGLTRLGITESTIKIGELADLGSPFREITERERTLLEDEVERLYQAFLSKVAAARKSSSEEIHKIAEGRIWAGADARERGLVDEEGGLDKALDYLKGKLKLKHIRVEFHPVVRYSLIQRIIMRNTAEIEAPASSTAGARLAARVASTAAFASSALAAGRPLAIAPELALSLDPAR